MSKIRYHNICYLLDVDGFYVMGQFLTKELASCDMRTGAIALYRFKVGDFSQLSARDRRNVTWVRNNIHGLNFSDDVGDRPQSDIAKIVREMCLDADQRCGLIGYKGGNYERDLLQRLGYAHLGFNIETLGCPRLEELIVQTMLSQSTIMPRCRYHRPIRACRDRYGQHIIRIPHCPHLELEYFRKFLENGVYTHPNNRAVEFVETATDTGKRKNNAQMKSIS